MGKPTVEQIQALLPGESFEVGELFTLSDDKVILTLLERNDEADAALFVAKFHGVAIGQWRAEWPGNKLKWILK